MSRLGKIALLGCLLLACCGDDSAGVASTQVSCDQAAEHLRGVCDDYTGEDFRALCEIEELPLVSASDRRCVGALRECDEDALEACNVRSVTIACRSDADCFAPLLCDEQEQECVRCFTDDDCAPGRGCLEDLCFDKDSEFYQWLSQLQARDAG